MQNSWHTLTIDQTLALLKTDRDGLSDNEALTRLRDTGPNRLPEPPTRSALMRFLAQFHNILIYVLLAAAVITNLWLDKG